LKGSSTSSACWSRTRERSRADHRVAKDDAYGQLPEPSSRGTYRLADDNITTATDDVAQQLSKAGVRLVFVLNKSLGR
jgi:hypothetical protein